MHKITSSFSSSSLEGKGSPLDLFTDTCILFQRKYKANGCDKQSVTGGDSIGRGPSWCWLQWWRTARVRSHEQLLWRQKSYEGVYESLFHAEDNKCFLFINSGGKMETCSLVLGVGDGSEECWENRDGWLVMVVVGSDLWPLRLRESSASLGL